MLIGLLFVGRSDSWLSITRTPPRMFRLVSIFSMPSKSAWVSACERDKPWRVPMRLRFAELLGRLPPHASILELESGPWDTSGLLRVHARAEPRTSCRFGAARFVHADFKTADWTRALGSPYSAVIAMQAVHEIRHKRHVPDETSYLDPFYTSRSTRAGRVPSAERAAPTCPSLHLHWPTSFCLHADPGAMKEVRRESRATEKTRA
jgi:hypothetical protein